MINETLTDRSAETLHDLIGFCLMAMRDAAFDQGRYHQGAKVAGEVKLFNKLRCQLVKRRASDGDGFEIVLSSGGQHEPKLEPTPKDGPTVTADSTLPDHLRKASIEDRVKRGEPVAITEMIEENRQKKMAGRNADGTAKTFQQVEDELQAGQRHKEAATARLADAGKVPAFLDRTKSHGTIDF